MIFGLKMAHRMETDMTDLFAAADLSAAKDALAKAYADFPPIGRCTPSQIDEAAAAVNQALHRVRIA